MRRRNGVSKAFGEVGRVCECCYSLCGRASRRHVVAGDSNGANVVADDAKIAVDLVREVSEGTWLTDL